MNSFLDLEALFDSKPQFNLHIELATKKVRSVAGFVKGWFKQFQDPYIGKRLYMS